MKLTFVVGTGRCGSTMLSEILRLHPDVLSVSEFFALLKAAARSRDFPTEVMDGASLWAMIAAPFPLLDALIEAGVRSSEMVYPYGTGRFTAGAGVPGICHHLLPRLTDDPDALYDKLSAEVPTWPLRPAAAHYRALFGYLAGIFGRQTVVERSATSLHLIPAMHEHFPEARFVHIYRDGPDCALSMSKHPMFRREMMQIAAIQAVRKMGFEVTSQEQLRARLPEEFRGLIFPPYDAKRFMSLAIPPKAFAQMYWAPMIREGVSALADLPGDSWIALKYEDLLADQQGQLRRLAQFVGVSAPEPWLELAGELIDPGRAGSAAARLDSTTLAELRAVCEPATQAVVAAGHHSGSARV